jgi:integrase
VTVTALRADQPQPWRPATYREYLVSVGLHPKTIRMYCWALDRAHAAITVTGGTLAEADPFELAALAQGVANSNATRSQLRCALKHYYLWIDRNDAPLRAIRVPPQPRMICRTLEPDEAHRLADMARRFAHPKGTATLLGLYLALRREEIASAEWGRFDGPLAWYTVTGKGDRTATIPVAPALTRYLHPLRSQDWIFPGRRGQRAWVSPATVWTWTKEVADAAGIEGFSTHRLRHTALTTALDNTSNLRSVQAFARHADPEQTAGYTRTTLDQLRGVADGLDY